MQCIGKGKFIEQPGALPEENLAAPRNMASAAVRRAARCYNLRMPIVILGPSQKKALSPTKYTKEKELETVLMSCPELLCDDNEVSGRPPIALVDSQVSLPEAGILDLLYVDKDGLPIAVEVKLDCNPQARREVVGQAIDYLSSLTALTVDELDKAVKGKLETALRSLADEDDSKFDELWQAVGEKLRAGKARLVVALNDAPNDLERIFRFLARSSSLDVQLLTIQKYPSDGELIYVSRTRVDPASEPQTGKSPARKEPYQELVAAANLYNQNAPQHLQAFGKAPDYRKVHLKVGTDCAHYGFRQNETSIVVRLRTLESQASLAGVLKTFAGMTISDGNGTLVFTGDDGGKAILSATFPRTTAPETVALAMHDLIELTRESVEKALKIT